MEEQKKEEIAKIIHMLDDLTKRGIIVNCIVHFDYMMDGDVLEFFACQSDQDFKDCTIDRILENYQK